MVQAVCTYFMWEGAGPCTARAVKLLSEGLHICNESRLFLFSIVLQPSDRWTDYRA